jgi:hypothetical protein
MTLPMIGDVNLFLKGSSKDEDFEIEVEIMIAGVYISPSRILMRLKSFEF